MNRLLGAMAAGIALMAAPVYAQGTGDGELRIGFMTTLTGPPAVIGQHLRDGFMLGVDHAGGKLGGMNTKVIVADDQLKPDVAVQEVEALLKRDNVHVVAGVVFSNILMAVYKPVTDSQAFLISSNAGPSPIAGARCSENFFSVSYQNDQNHGAVGKYVAEAGFKNVFLMAPNYQAGKDALTGFKRHYKGKVADEVYTKLGQLDFSAEIARIQSLKPDAVYTFMPGGMGVNLVKQYVQAGLKDQIPLFSAFTVDETTLPALQDAAMGLTGAAVWAANVDNPASRKFVEDFRAKHGYVPSYYAAQAYDTARLIDAAVRQAGGVADKDKLRAALRKADFESLRGEFRFNHNHFPIQDFHLVQADTLSDGAPALLSRRVIFNDYADDYAKECKMKW